MILLHVLSALLLAAIETWSAIDVEVMTLARRPVRAAGGMGNP